MSPGDLVSHGVRTMGESDIAQVVAIAAGIPTAPHWPPQEFDRMLHVIAERPARRGAWVAVMQDTVTGFAMASHVAGVAELEAVVTAPAYRQRGIGAALVACTAHWARGVRAERLLLEVRASNYSALHLYARQGFVQDGLRRGYYRSPDEDAVLLRLLL